MDTIERVLLEQPFLAGIDPAAAHLLAACTRNVRFERGLYLFHEGEPADELYLLRAGMVAIEIAAPGRAPVTITTLREGDVVGASWLVPPYRWTFDARAVEPTSAFGVDAACLRSKCDADGRFGYDIMKRFVPVLVQRLQAARLQILDVYAKRSAL